MKPLFLLCALTTSLCTNAQLGICYSTGNSGDDAVKALLTDASGNVYATGYFTGTTDFAPGASVSTLTSAGDADMFLVKYSSTGTLLFAKSIGGTGNDYGSAMAFDGAGNIILVGNFSGSIDADPGAGTTTLTSGGSHDMMIAKYNLTTGALTWAESLSGSGDDNVRSVTLDAGSNIVVAGALGYGSMDADPGAGTATLTNVSSYSANNIFFAKYNASGAYVWAKSLSGCCDEAFAVRTDASNNVFIAGLFQGSLDFDPGAGYAGMSAYYYGDIYLAKYDASGNYVWVKKLDGYNQSDNADCMVFDNAGNIILGGEQGGPGNEDFDFDAGVTNLYANAYYSGFIAKYTSSGGFLWAMNFGSTLYNEVYALAVDASNNIYATGFFSGTTDFDPGAGTTNLVSAGGYDAFYLKLNSSGALVTAERAGGTGYDYGLAIAVRGTTAIIGGSYQGTGYFGGAPSNSVGSSDMFMTQLTASPLSVELISFSATKNNKDVTISWELQQEQSMEGYRVERSTDGITFTSLHWEPTHNEAGRTHHAATDAAPAAGDNFYRLQMVGTDGSLSYSAVQQVHIDRALQVKFIREGSSYTIDIEGYEGGTTAISVTDIAGKQILNTQFSGAQYRFYPGVKGLYIIKLILPDGGTVIEKLIL